MSKSGGDDTPQSPVILVPGEPSGIGLELTLRLLDQRPELFADTQIVANSGLLEAALERLRKGGVLASDPLGRATIHDIPAPSHAVTAGEPDARNADYVLDSFACALELVGGGALVTGPVDKTVVAARLPEFRGVTGFLAEHYGCSEVIMLLHSEHSDTRIRVAVVTHHIPLSRVTQEVTRPRLVDFVVTLHERLQHHFALDAPRLGLLGINPHAGEGGMLGDEDEEVTVPAVRELRDRGIDVIGPLPGDTAFIPQLRRRIDCHVAMYHDQGLVAVKTLAFATAVNTTLGLPIVRTAVAHGTAYDLVGTDRANVQSLASALESARRQVQARARS